MTYILWDVESVRGMFRQLLGGALRDGQSRCTRQLTRGRLVWIGFDQDLYSNETVCFHLASLVLWAMRETKCFAM
jgi:hypothetical protein